MSKSLAADPASEAARAAAPGGLTRADLGLYVVLVTVWGTSWIALHHQLGVVAPVVSLVWRFALSAAICVGIALARREPLRFPLRMHARFMLAGVLMYSTNFLFFYHAGAHVPSGLLAVVFALASAINLGLGALFFGRPIEMRVLVGAALGVVGVGLLYLPQIASAGFGAAALGGLALCVAGTLCFCLGNMISSVIQRQASDLAATTWGMIYGTLWLLAAALASGAEFAFEPSWSYGLSLLWLAAGSSVAAFLAYLALLKRIGPARAGFATVLFPVVALAISSVFETYAWTVSALVGVALVAAGNIVVLGLARRR